MSTERSHYCGHLLQVLKRISSTSDFIHIFSRHNQQFVSWSYLYPITAAAENTLISMGNTFSTCVFFESKTNRTSVQTDCTILVFSKKHACFCFNFWWILVGANSGSLYSPAFTINIQATLVISNAKGPAQIYFELSVVWDKKCYFTGAVNKMFCCMDHIQNIDESGYTVPHLSHICKICAKLILYSNFPFFLCSVFLSPFTNSYKAEF